MAKVSPSVLGVDFLNCTEKLFQVEKGGASYLHIDVMDGVFVPNISFGAPVAKSFKKHTPLPLDVHLMIEYPQKYVGNFAEIAEFVGFHSEAKCDIAETISIIKKAGAKPCLTMKPKTEVKEIIPYLKDISMVLVMSVEPGFGGQSFMPSSLEKVKELKKIREKENLDFLIEIDGGINENTATLAVKAGVDVLVAGNYLFNCDETEKRTRDLVAL